MRTVRLSAQPVVLDAQAASPGSPRTFYRAVKGFKLNPLTVLEATSKGNASSIYRVKPHVSRDGADLRASFSRIWRETDAAREQVSDV